MELSHPIEGKTISLTSMDKDDEIDLNFYIVVSLLLHSTFLF